MQDVQSMLFGLQKIGFSTPVNVSNLKLVAVHWNTSQLTLMKRRLMLTNKIEIVLPTKVTSVKNVPTLMI